MANLFTRIKSRLWGDATPRERIVIYTAVTGNYDTLKVPLVIKPYFDYVAYVDDPDFPVPYPWQRREITRKERSRSVTARYYKLHPHELFPDYQTSVYVDASFEISSDFSKLIEMSLSQNDVAFFAHPERNCIYEEAKVVLALGMDKEAVVAAQMQKYREEGFPENNGLFASGLIIRRHNLPQIKKIMNEWWEEVNAHSHRDQLSGQFIFWRNGLSWYPIEGNVFLNQYVAWKRDISGDVPYWLRDSTED